MIDNKEYLEKLLEGKKYTEGLIKQIFDEFEESTGMEITSIATIENTIGTRVISKEYKLNISPNEK